LKITDLKLNELHLNSLEQRYNLVIKDEDTIADVIYRFLFSDRSVIQLEGSSAISHNIKNTYLTKLKTLVSKGAPIDFFLTTFSPKFKKENISNGWIYPDIADYLTLIHLQLIAKAIREIYPYNFRFIIAYKGDLYQRVGGWDKEELDKTFTILKELNLSAEKLTGTRNSIVLTRWPEMFGDNLSEFESRWELKSEHYYQLWNEKKEPYHTQIERWKKDLTPCLDIELGFKEVFDFFLTKEACRIRAFNNLIFREGKALDLLQQLHPNLLVAHTRRNSKFFSILLNPYFQNRTHLKKVVRNKKWEMYDWKTIDKKGYEPVYIDGYEYPFFFKTKKDNAE